MKIWILLFLIMAAIYDYRDFKIPNKLNGAGALITLVLAGVSGMKAADMMIGVLVVLISCGLLFYIGCLGGGDWLCSRIDPFYPQARQNKGEGPCAV